MLIYTDSFLEAKKLGFFFRVDAEERGRNEKEKKNIGNGVCRGVNTLWIDAFSTTFRRTGKNESEEIDFKAIPWMGGVVLLPTFMPKLILELFYEGSSIGKYISTISLCIWCIACFVLSISTRYKRSRTTAEVPHNFEPVTVIAE
ncbi:hypothetical protein TNCV_4807421 [Trichonephila clavipes]|nr:hypothetical protein TNCV_4807421 [Trichonephila clavipes]